MILTSSDVSVMQREQVMADDERDIHFLTNDIVADPARDAGGRKTTRLDPTDQQIYQQSVTGEGLIPIESMEQLQALAEAAMLTKQVFDDDVAILLTPERAAEVRRLRGDEGYSWRAVAHACHDAWAADLPEEMRWFPPSNQLMGMALCEAAARHFGEDSDKPPWN